MDLELNSKLKPKLLNLIQTCRISFLTPILSLEYLEFNSISRHRSRALIKAPSKGRNVLNDLFLTCYGHCFG